MLEKKDEYADCHPEIRQGMLFLTKSALQYAVDICRELPYYRVSIVVNQGDVVDILNIVLKICNQNCGDTHEGDVYRAGKVICFNNNSAISVIADENLGRNTHWHGVNEIIVDRNVCVNGNKFGLKCY